MEKSAADPVLNSVSRTQNQIHTWPKSERPRERLFEIGGEALSTGELLAILLGSGRKGVSAVDLARELLADSARPLPTRSLHELAKWKGVGSAKACRIVAAFELGRRLLIGRQHQSVSLTTSRSAFEYLQGHFFGRSEEVFIVVTVDVKNRPISIDEIARGTSETVAFLPRKVFEKCMALSASGLICAHNHPSGSPEPSRTDIELTDRLKNGANILGIRLLDHLVISNDSYFSFADTNQLRMSQKGK